MKKAILILLTFIFCITFIGCSNKTEPNTSKTDHSPAAESTRSSASTQSSESQQQTESQVKTTGMPESAVKTNINGLYQFKNGMAESSQLVNALISGDVLIYEFITPGLDMNSEKIVTYSLSDDKVLGKLSLPENVWSTGVMDNGGFYTVSLLKHEIVFYDRLCNETYRKTLSDPGNMWSFAVVSSDGKKLLYNNIQDGSLILYTFSDNTTLKFNQVNGMFLPIGFKGEYFYIRNFQSGILRISFEKKILETVYNGGTTYFTTPDYEVGMSDSFFVLTPLDNPDNRIKTKTADEYETPVTAVDNLFATCVYDKNDDIVRLYNIKDSTVSPDIKIPGEVQKLLFCTDEMLLIITRESNSVAFTYYLYDLSENSGYKDITLLKDEATNENSVPEWQGDEKTVSLAQSILDTYGVRVLYGKDDINTETFSYSSDPLDIDAAYAKLQNVEKVLSYFPKGMTQEFGRGNETWIYLRNEIRYSGTDKTIDGFASNLGVHPLIVIDSDCSDSYFKETLVHEISHIIDYCVNAAWLNGWTALLPESIAANAYYNSYNVDYSNAYTPYDDGKTEVWFYSHYARTFPTEDRAVTFQKMYLSSIEGKLTDEFSKYENVSKKARYYCVMLRNTFDSCKNTASLPWEQPFGKIDASEFNVVNG